MCESESKPLTTQQAAKSLGVSQSSIKRWIDSGQLRAQKSAGGHRRVQWQDLLSFANHHGHGLTRQADEPSLHLHNASQFQAALYQCLKDSDYSQGLAIIRQAELLLKNKGALASQVMLAAFQKLRSECPHPSERCNILHRGLECLILACQHRTSNHTPSKTGIIYADLGYEIDSLPTYLAQYVCNDMIEGVQLGRNCPQDVVIGALKRFKPRIIFLSASGPYKKKAVQSALEQIASAANEIKTRVCLFGWPSIINSIDVRSFEELQGLIKVYQAELRSV